MAIHLSNRVGLFKRVGPPLAEVDLLVGSAAKAKEKLGWQAETDLETLCRLMVDADLRRNDQGVSF